MISESIVGNEETNASLTKNNKFTCRTSNDESDIFECMVYEFKDTDANVKNHYAWNNINDYFNTQAQQSTLKTINKIFKVEFTGKYRIKDKNTKIEIINSEPTSNKKYSSLKQWIDKNSQTTQYFIGKAKFFHSASINAKNTTNDKCEFKEIYEEMIKEEKSCKIFEFSSNETSSINENSTYTEITFNKTTTNTTTTILYKHYFIKFDEDVNIDKLKEYLTFGSTKSTISILKNLKSAFYREELEQIFIK